MRLLQTQREAPHSAGYFFAGAGLHVCYIAERCPYLAGFQDITLAGQKDAPNVRPYIGSALPAANLVALHPPPARNIRFLLQFL